MKTDCMRDSRICRQQSTTTASRTSVWRNDKPSSSADVNAGMRRIVSGISRPRKLTEESNSHAVTNCREWSEALQLVSTERGSEAVGCGPHDLRGARPYRQGASAIHFIIFVLTTQPNVG